MKRKPGRPRTVRADDSAKRGPGRPRKVAAIEAVATTESSRLYRWMVRGGQISCTVIEANDFTTHDDGHLLLWRDGHVVAAFREWRDVIRIDSPVKNEIAPQVTLVPSQETHHNIEVPYTQEDLNRDIEPLQPLKDSNTKDETAP